MPQLSLYIDKETLEKLELAARIEHLSLSKYAVKKLNESLRTDWPDTWAALFGSLDDPTYGIDRNPDLAADAPREVF